MPELCLLSSLLSLLKVSSKKIGTFSDFENLDNVDQEDLLKYDFVLFPQTFMEKFDDEIFDLIINTTSLGEMSDIMQDYYLQNLEDAQKNIFIVLTDHKKS